jgi:hypothetical protein
VRAYSRTFWSFWCRMLTSQLPKVSHQSLIGANLLQPLTNSPRRFCLFFASSLRRFNHLEFTHLLTSTGTFQTTPLLNRTRFPTLHSPNTNSLKPHVFSTTFHSKSTLLETTTPSNFTLVQLHNFQIDTILNSTPIRALHPFEIHTVLTSAHFRPPHTLS